KGAAEAKNRGGTSLSVIKCELHRIAGCATCFPGGTQVKVETAAKVEGAEEEEETVEYM
ncbi:hypothetical protein TeGR_g11942, partial [Tetraparma gracilis]